MALAAGPAQAAFSASTRDALRPAAYGMSAAYLLITMPPVLTVYSGTTRVAMSALMVAASLVCAAVGWISRPDRRPSWYSMNGFVALLACVPTVTSLASLAVRDDPFQTVNLVLVLVVSAALIQVRATALLVGTGVLAGWALTGVLFAPAAVTVDTVGAMTMATLFAVIVHLARRRTVSRLEAARWEIAQMAVTDDLTGLSNRRALYGQGAALLQSARRAGQDVAVVYVDIDGLKALNDSCGHAAGDGRIRRVAQVLRAVFADADMVARTGGDEFAVVLRGRGAQEVEMLRARLSAELDRAGAAASCGVAHLAATDPPLSLEQLLDGADLAMYGTKKRRARPRTDAVHLPPEDVDARLTARRTVGG